MYRKAPTGGAVYDRVVSSPMVRTMLRSKLRFALPIALFAAAPGHAEITGTARAVDGDTVVLAGQEIHLYGVDAPEEAQVCEADGEAWPCGREAKAALRKLIRRAWIRCAERARDLSGRSYSLCRVSGPDGPLLNRAMVAEGWALADRETASDFVADEARAKAVGNGVWRGAFVPPWEWRRGKRLAVETGTGDPECLIKGNINSLGKRIYFTRESAFYNSVVIDETAGERWFCSEQEAHAAGWRRSKW